MDLGTSEQGAASLEQSLHSIPGVLTVLPFSFVGRGKTFRGTTIGMAPLEGMCSMDNSGGVSVVRRAWVAPMLLPLPAHLAGVLHGFGEPLIWGWSLDVV